MCALAECEWRVAAPEAVRPYCVLQQCSMLHRELTRVANQHFLERALRRRDWMCDCMCFIESSS